MTSISDPQPGPGSLSVDELLEHSEWLRSLSARLVADENVGDDLVQRTWLRAMGKPPRREGGSVRAWLGRVLFNEARSDRRAERRRRSYELDSGGGADAGSMSPEPGELDERLQLQQRLVGAVRGLREPYRTAITLRYLEQKTVPEVAEHTGVPVRTVETRLRRAREILRDRLDQHYGSKAAWAGLALPLALPKDTPFARPGAPGATPFLAATGITMGLKKITIPIVLLFAAFTGWRLTAERGLAGDHSPGQAVGGTADLVLAEPEIEPVPDEDVRVAVLTDVADCPRAEPSAAPGPLVTVVLRDPDGQPLDGADVRLSAEMDGGSGLFEFRAPPLGEQPAAEPTGLPGLYRAPARADVLYLLVVRAADFATVERGGCSAGDVVKITMAHEAALKGVVVDAETKLPVAWATARAFHGDSERYEEALTGDDGEFLFQGLMPGEVSYVVLPRLHAGVRHSTVEILGGETKELRFEVDPVDTITGQVTDATSGLPIGTAEVSLSPFFKPGQAVDALGRYVLGAPQRSPGQVTARAPGYAPSSARPGAGESTVDLQLSPELTIRGRIADGQGKPVDGAFIGVRGFDGEGRQYLAPDRPTMASALGEYSLGGLRGDGYFVISAGAAGYAPTQVTVQMEELSFSRRGAEIAPLVLVSAASLSGRVLTENGDPVPGARVYLERHTSPLPPGEFAASERRMTYCAADGAFRIWGLSEGTWNARVVAPGNATMTLLFAMTGGEQRTGVIWTLEGAGTPSLVGLVTGPSGAPLDGAFVSLRQTAKDAGPGQPQARVESVRTDAAGRFEFGHVPDSEYSLQVSPPELGQREWKWRDPDAETLLPATLNGVRPDGRLVEVQLEACTSSLAGHVVDADGKGMPNAFVCLDLGRGHSLHGTLTNARGAFELAVPPRGFFKLSAWGTGPLESKVGNRSSVEVELGRALLGRFDEPAGGAMAGSGSREILVRL